MVDELLNGDACRQLRKASDMITMVVSRDQVIDPREAGIFDRGHDAIGVTSRAGASVA
jgi:hypothetical protein